MKLNYLVRGPRIDDERSVRLEDMQPERLAEWRTFMKIRARERQKESRAPTRNPKKGIEGLVERTKEYQEDCGLAQTGELNLETMQAALADPQWPGVVISPLTGEAPDFRRRRPYFLLPVLESRLPFQQEIIRAEIEKAVKAIKADSQGSGKVSDIFVVSHGWHRNYLGGVSAYDRLLSRFSVLLQRGVLKQDRDFQPLFIAVHWNSDPGPDVWSDPAGRRDKASFMAQVQAVFEPRAASRENDEKFVVDFEEFFEQLSCNVAPDTVALEHDTGSLEKLTSRLEAYRYRSAEGDPTIEEKITTLWRCFWESEAKGFLVDQTNKPKPLGDAWTSISLLLKFVVAVVGLPTLIGLAWKRLSAHPASSPEASSLVDRVGQWLSSQLTEFCNAIGIVEGYRYYAAAFLWCVLSLLVLGVYGLLMRIRHKQADRNVNGRALPIPQLTAWIVPQLLFTIPALVFLFATFIFRTPLALIGFLALCLGQYGWGIGILAGCTVAAWIGARFEIPISGVFRERLVGEDDAARNPRDLLTVLARWPIRLMDRAVASDSSVRKLTSAVDNQLAFFAMQRKGVQAGVETGIFVRNLVNELELTDAKIHLVGHSFGGLVVTNAARTLTGTPRFSQAWSWWLELIRPKPKEDSEKNSSEKDVEIQTLCTIQGAFAANWYQGEQRLVEKTKGAIACIFSGYDTATGFYYPVANNARLSAGNLGICRIGERKEQLIKHGYREAVYLGRNGQFAMVVKPPDLTHLYEKEVGRLKDRRHEGTPMLMNIDASRLCYFGAVATGGGHDDIFKDDVVNLFWAVSQVAASSQTPPRI